MQLAPAPTEAPLAPRPRRWSRLRSDAVRALTARLAPPSVLFVRGPRDDRRKRIALTFDDGPDAMTLQYLDVLEALGVRATFFVIGENVARGAPGAFEYERRGHEIGGHGWTHTPFPSLRTEDLAAELARTADAIGSAGRRLVRPPRGALSPRALLQIAAAGFTTVLWSVDSDDCRTRDPREVERRLSPASIRAGDVVLMHEFQPWTLQALAGSVRALRDHGFDFVTITELMRGTDV